MGSTKTKQTDQLNPSTSNTQEPEYYFRFYEQVHNDPYTAEETGELFRGRVEIQLERYLILRRTPKGVWIRRWSGNKPETFVLNDSPKKVAWPTVDEAKMHFFTRKKNQISLLLRQLNRAKEALWTAAEKWDLDPGSHPKPVPLSSVYGTAVLLGEDEPDEDDIDDLQLP